MEAWRPHLQFAYEALLTADQMMRSSPTPDVAGVQSHLRTAFLELQRLPPIFEGRRATAMSDVQRAVNHLKQTPPNPGAIGLTDDAILNVQACMKMHG